MFTKTKKAGTGRILIIQAGGFLTIITLSLLNEWLHLPSLVLKNHPYITNYPEFILEMLFVLTVWFLVAMATRRITDRLRHLERFMLVCAWCNRIKFMGSWIPLEEFLARGFDTPTSHGICTHCLEAQKAEHERAARRNKDLSKPRQAPQT